METWQVTGETACLSAAPWHAQYEFNRPRLGLQPLGPQGVPFANLLGIDVPGFEDPISATKLIDQYVRDGDLVVAYEHPSPNHLRVQLDWRLTQQTVSDVSQGTVVCTGVRLLVSLTTDRLDARPTLTACSSLPSSELISLALAELVPDRDSALAVRVSGNQPTNDHPLLLSRGILPGGSSPAMSLVLMAYPRDLVQVERTTDDETGGHQLSFQLLGEHLEKGVIRRAQLAAWLVPQSDDERLARRLFQHFVESPPPISR